MLLIEISSDLKHCPWFEGHSIVDLGHYSHCFHHLTVVVHWVSFQNIQKNYHRNVPGTFDGCSRKRQGILKQVWSCSGRIPRAWAYSNLESQEQFSEYWSPERPYLSPTLSRSVGTGRREPWEQGWERPSSLKCKLRRSLCFSRKSELIEYLVRPRLLLRHRNRNV